MERFGFRWFLPICMGLAFVSLIGMLYLQDRDYRRLYPTETSWPPIQIDPPHVSDVALGIRALVLPGFLLGTPLAFLADVALGNSKVTEILYIAVSALCLLIVWHLLGRWVDKLIGWLPNSGPPPPAVRVLLAGLAMVLAALALASFYFDNGRDGFFDIGLWFAVFAGLLAWQVRVWNQRAEQEHGT